MEITFECQTEIFHHLADRMAGFSAVTESVERGPQVWEIWSLVPGRVKPMVYKMYTCHFVARRSTLIE